MQKRNELLKEAGIVPVTDKTSLYAKYGMLPEGKTNEYKNRHHHKATSQRRIGKPLWSNILSNDDIQL